MALHWFLTVSLLAASVLTYLFMFWLPIRGITLKGCPSACTYNSDCRVPRCGTPDVRDRSEFVGSREPQIRINRNKTQITCFRNRCRLSTGHKQFFGAALVFGLLLLGLGAIALGLFKNSMKMQLGDDGITYTRFNAHIHIPWDEFLGITYHGVNTRTGRDATIYSLSGDTGIISFIVPGLPANTTTRELELSAFFYLKLNREEFASLRTAILEKTGDEPRPEHEW